MADRVWFGCILLLIHAACGRIAFDPIVDPKGTHSRRIVVRGPVTGTLPDFPLLVRWDADAEVAAVAEAGADRIWFEDANHQQLPHETERFDPAIGALTAWVRVDISEGTELWFRLGLDGPSSDPRAVWSDYEAVWHLGVYGASAAYVDATRNTPDGVPVGSAAIDAALIESGLRPSAGWIDAGDYPSLDFGPQDSFTVSQWVRFDALTATWQTVIYKGAQDPLTPGYGIETQMDFSEIYGCVHDGVAAVQTCDHIAPPPPVGAWSYVALVVDRGVQRMRLSLDGADGAPGVDVTGIDPDPNGNSPPLQIGAKDTFLMLDGLIDEVRIARRAFTTPRLAAEHRNQLMPEQFLMLDAFH